MRARPDRDGLFVLARNHVCDRLRRKKASSALLYGSLYFGFRVDAGTPRARRQHRSGSWTLSRIVFTENPRPRITQ